MREELRSDDDGMLVTDCQGSLIIGESRIEVTFDFSCDIHGELHIQIAPLPLDETTKPLLDFCNARERNTAFCTLEGRATQSGYTVSSDSVCFESAGRGTAKRSAMLQPLARVGRVEVTAGGELCTEDADTVTYKVVGLRGRPHTSAGSPVGRVTITAGMRLDRFDQITGCIAIEKSSTDAVDENQPDDKREGHRSPDWLLQCDTQVRSLLDILSFAQGRLIRWSIRQVFRGDQLICAVFDGPQRTTNPVEPTFFDLNSGPVVKLALCGYTEELRERTGIDVAIEWFLMNPRYDEAQLLALMTALEHLVSVFDKKQKDGGYLPEGSFKRLKALLREAADKFLNDQDTGQAEYARARTGIAAIKESLRYVNKPDFKTRLAQMLESYSVPTSGIGGEIESLVQARNKIVHRGLYQPSNPESNRLSDLVGVARELLRRTFLALLEFEGEYRTWVNGPECAYFPPQATPPR